MQIDVDRFAELAGSDLELAQKLTGLTARVRVGPDASPIDLSVTDGRLGEIGPRTMVEADVVIAAPDRFWLEALQAQPPYAACSLTAGGADIQGDFQRHVAPYLAAFERILVLLRITACGGLAARPDPAPRRETDDAVGRYAYVRNGELEARIYHEQAGDGPIPLLLHATAGADGRQWRHMLADPELRRRFRMIAYDLPGHGKSLPPIGARWWEESYRASKALLMGWAVGLVETLGLDRPVFLGCSVGGQLALDLAAHHADRFRAFVSLNGWYDASPGMLSFDNAPFRSPAVSAEYSPAKVLATTSPLAPEASRQEACWIYRSNAPGVYAGDNDYFMHDHDLKEDGHLIDTARTPLFVLAGEYDRSASSREHGAPAIARNVPGAIYRELPSLGHFAPSDDPEGFCAAILPVLDEVIAACRAGLPA